MTDAAANIDEILDGMPPESHRGFLTEQLLRKMDEVQEYSDRYLSEVNALTQLKIEMKSLQRSMQRLQLDNATMKTTLNQMDQAKSHTSIPASAIPGPAPAEVEVQPDAHPQ